MMGDVDVLIERCDTEKVHSLLQTISYTTDDDIFKENGHIGYKRGNKGQHLFAKFIFPLTAYLIRCP